MPETKLHRTLRAWTLTTLATCYLLIAAGATVRATGSGLGCPDWPQCFGRWIPPLHAHELPVNYQEVFAIKGKHIAPFSALKTWTEYLNRLLGMVVGLEVLLLLALALKFPSPPIRRLAVMAFCLVGLQGWLGQQVVASHLSSPLITLHMLIAMVILLILWELALELLSWRKPLLPMASPLPPALPSSPRRSYGILLALTLLQIVLGTTSRQQIDRYLHGTILLDRSEWYHSLGGAFSLHRLGACGLVMVFLWHLYQQRKVLTPTEHRWVTTPIALTLGLQLLSGLCFKLLNFPSWNQPLHLLLGSGLVSTIFVGLRINQKRALMARQASSTAAW